MGNISLLSNNKSQPPQSKHSNNFLNPKLPLSLFLQKSGKKKKNSGIYFFKMKLIFQKKHKSYVDNCFQTT